MNERRLSPVPAGSGMPGSIAGSPLPALAAAPRSSSERENSLQPQFAMAQPVCRSGETPISCISAFCR